MRIYSIHLIIFCLFTICSNGQTLGQQYKSLTNAAELAIIKQNYGQALLHYEKAFDLQINFGVDLYNASVCAAKQNDTKKVLIFADKLASKGVGEAFFSKKIYRKYKNNKKFKKIKAKAAKIYLSRKQDNEQYLNHVERLYRRDSLYNQIRQARYNEHYKLPDTLEALFKRNTEDLLSLIKSEGYHSEAKLGVKLIKDTIIQSTIKSDIILLHYLEMGSDKQMIDSIRNMVETNLNNGTIKDYHAGAFIEMTYGIFRDIGKWTLKIHNCDVYKKNDVENLEAIEYFRNSYCMESLENFQDKIEFVYSGKSDFDFRYYLIQEHISDESFFNKAFHKICTIKDCNR